MKLDRLMECVLDTTNPGETEDALTSSQPTFEWRPPTRDTAGLERRLGRMEENVAAIHQTMKTVVDLLQNEKVRSQHYASNIFRFNILFLLVCLTIFPYFPFIFRLERYSQRHQVSGGKPAFFQFMKNFASESENVWL